MNEVNMKKEGKGRMELKARNGWMLLIIALLLLSGCSAKTKEETTTNKDNPKHSVFNLDADSVKDLDKGILRGTPLKLDKNLKLSDIEKVWGKPDRHRDLEERQEYRYTIQNQTFYIFVNDSNEINDIHVELNYSKSEILKAMGKPTKSGHLFFYEKDKQIIQFEKNSEKWRLMLFIKEYYF